jgi:hypothetical protein
MVDMPFRGRKAISDAIPSIWHLQHNTSVALNRPNGLPGLYTDALKKLFRRLAAMAVEGIAAGCGAGGARLHCIQVMVMRQTSWQFWTR